MTKLTRAQIQKTLQPGDVILVHYLSKNLVSAGIQFASGGLASHALCCLGGMEVVEADLGGVMHSFVDTYMTGKTRLTVKRMRPVLDHREAAGACVYWRACVSQPYDTFMILHVAAATPIRRLVLPVCPPLGRFLLRALGRISWASHTLSTCAELYARGIKVARQKFLRGYDLEDITPEVLLRDAASLETVVVWEAPVFVGGK